METATKEGAARCNRATPARQTSPPAGRSRSQIIAQKRFRAKYRRRRIALLLVLAAIVTGATYAIVHRAPAEQPAAAPNTTAELATPSPLTTPAETEAAQPSADLPAPRYALDETERDTVERVVMAEAGGECYEGQMLVAQCILNAAEKTGTAPSEAVRTYQYTKSRPEPTQGVKDAVKDVFDDGETVTDEPILYFYNPARVTSTWHESQIFVIEVGGHRFFAERSATK